jgi:glycerol kinase
VEHNALEIWENTQEVTRGALRKANCNLSDIATIGIINQREMALIWEKATGRSVYNAIVWQDTRTDTILQRTGENGRPGSLQTDHRPAPGDLFLRPQNQVDLGQRSRHA